MWRASGRRGRVPLTGHCVRLPDTEKSQSSLLFFLPFGKDLGRMLSDPERDPG